MIMQNTEYSKYSLLVLQENVTGKLPERKRKSPKFC